MVCIMVLSSLIDFYSKFVSVKLLINHKMLIRSCCRLGTQLTVVTDDNKFAFFLSHMDNLCVSFLNKEVNAD